MKRAIGGLALALTLTGCAGTAAEQEATDKTAASTSTQPAPEPAPEPAEPSPDGKYTVDCTYVLGDFSDYTQRGLRFIGEARLRNTGNVGVVMKVDAKWFQLGTKPVVRSKTVRLAYKARSTVRFSVPVGHDEIDLIQALNSKQCSVRASMVDTFGDPRG